MYYDTMELLHVHSYIPSICGVFNNSMDVFGKVVYD